MDELLKTATELALVWGEVGWGARIALLAPLVVTGSSALSALLPDHLSPKTRTRINKLLRGVHSVVDLTALNVGKAKRAKRQKREDDADV